MACPFCALGMPHFALAATLDQQFRQRARKVHPDKRTPEFKEQADVEIKLLGNTRDLALLYTEAGAMPFTCPGLAQTLLPDPVPIRAATRWPVYMPFGASTQWPAAGSRDRPDQEAAGSRDQPDQETDPTDTAQHWTQKKWRWIGKCQQCGITAHSAWAHGAATPKLFGWSKRHRLCPECNKW